jgi:hypothetical protein
MRAFLFLAAALGLTAAAAQAETLDEALIAVHKPYYAQRMACDQPPPVSSIGGQEDLLRVMAAQRQCLAVAESQHEQAVEAVRARFKADCAARGPATIGMTVDQVLASCQGLLTRRHVTVTELAKIRDEQWVYDHDYLYFRNSILDAIQHR